MIKKDRAVHERLRTDLDGYSASGCPLKRAALNAARRLFSLTFGFTHRDVVHWRSPVLTADARVRLAGGGRMLAA